MKDDKVLLDNVKRLMIARYPRFAQEIANTSLQFNSDLPFKTAATDGKNIYFDPDFFDSISDENKLFIIAHELMHIKFQHMFRMTDKLGKLRDSMTWNIATDAIINANLERDGFKIQEGAVNMPEAIQYNAEELYEKLLKEKQENQQQSGNNNKTDNNNSSDNLQQNQQQNNNQNQNQSNSNNKKLTDDHGIWKKAFEESQEQKNKQKKKSTQNSQSNQGQSSKNSQLNPNSQITEFDEFQFDERAEFQENRKQRRENAKRNIEQMRSQELRKNNQDNIELGKIGKSKAILDWKLLLRREVEKTETIWSQRRSIAENNYAYRLEENDVEDQAETEVMIDVSGSVSLEMVKAFLRQLKPILKESKLKVGCFNEKFWGLSEIKSDKDIDNFKIPSAARGASAWTEDWDLAVRSFSKKREVNKIVFTDGEPCPGTMPQDDLKNINVIWIVYRNKKFEPCCGKVIFVDKKEFQKNNYIYENDEQEFTA